MCSTFEKLRAVDMAGYPKKKTEEAKQLTSLQSAHLRKRKRHPTQSQIRLATNHEQIRLELHRHFAEYIAADAETLLEQIDSAICALRNEGLARGVSPSTRMSISLLIKWKDAIR